MGNRLNHFILVIIVTILGFLAYSNSLNGKFIWDDESLIENNNYIYRYGLRV